ncbi:MAG: SLC13 family permease [bacterium]
MPASYRPLRIFLGLLCFGLLLFMPRPDGLSAEGQVVLALTALMAIWWVSEAIPIPVTALLPLVILPLFGVMPIATAAIPYASKIVLLLMGGFIIAKSVERWQLHRRIALTIVSKFGSRPSALIAGFMLASAVLSMWISNTATTIMLAPIALSTAQAVTGSTRKGEALTIALLLGIAWAASIGGLGTPVGTPTNLIVIEYLDQNFGIEISFDQWMQLGLPVVAVLLPAAWLVLTRWGIRLPAQTGAAGHSVVTEALAALGKMRAPEARVLMVFSLIALLWVFRRPISHLDIAGLTPFAGLTDHVIAIAGAILVFLIPSGCKSEKDTALLDWESAQQIPWGVLLLFGGGLSLASAITSSGMAVWLGDQMHGITTLPLIIIILIIVTFVIFATELTSNVATASALLPVIGAIALKGEADPLLLAAPVAMAASCAFMLPIATGPNAIVFASGEFSVQKMAMTGLRLNLLAIALITGTIYLLAPRVLGA